MKKSTFVVTEVILSVILAASVGAAAVLALDIKSGGNILPKEWFANDKPQTSQTSEKSTPQESSTAAAEISAPEESSTAEEETPEPTNTGWKLTAPSDLSGQPTELTTYLSDFGYTYDTLDTDHFILVATTSLSSANIYCYQRSESGYWWNIAGDGKAVTDKGYIGDNGADFEVAPGSDKTPLGIYSLGSGFYCGGKPQTDYPLYAITENTLLVDDPESGYYNQFVEGTEEKDWESAVKMADDKKSYRYGLVVNYNTSSPDSEYAAGIFMCCGDKSTHGSIVVPEKVMQGILEWLSEDSNPYIFVTPLIG